MYDLSAVEKLRELRIQAATGEAQSCWGLSALAGGLLVVASLYFPALSENKYLLVVWLALFLTGTLLAYPFAGRWFCRVYLEASDTLTTSTLPVQLLDESFQQSVVERMPTPLFKVEVPRKLEDQVRFGAKHWQFFVRDQRRYPGRESIYEMFQMTRLKAICDFFLDSAKPAP